MLATIIRLSAPNSPNGNPRRVYLALTSDGAIDSAWDEGYAGYRAVPVSLQTQARNCATFPTTYKGYRDALKAGK